MDETQKKELSDKLLSCLGSMEDAVNKGGDFVVEHAPETVQQFLAYELWSNAATAIFSLCVVLATLIVARIFWKAVPGVVIEGVFADIDINMFRVILSVVATVITLTGSTQAYGHSLEALKIYMAPNVHLLEWAAELVQAGN